jgi:hypothetical protein
MQLTNTECEGKSFGIFTGGQRGKIKDATVAL